MAESMANLNITDITDAVRVIDYASEQGAFRGWENIRQILALRDRLDSFVFAANSASTAAAETDDEQGPVSPLPTANTRRPTRRKGAN